MKNYCEGATFFEDKPNGLAHVVAYGLVGLEKLFSKAQELPVSNDLLINNLILTLKCQNDIQQLLICGGIINNDGQIISWNEIPEDVKTAKYYENSPISEMSTGENSSLFIYKGSINKIEAKPVNKNGETNLAPFVTSLRNESSRIPTKYFETLVKNNFAKTPTRSLVDPISLTEQILFGFAKPSQIKE